MRTTLAVAGLAVLAAAALAQQTEAPPDGRLAYIGRVVDAGGKPVAGAVVYADNGGSYQTMKSWDETPWKLLVPDPLSRADTGPWTVRGREPTAADGWFRVDGVQPPAGEGWVLIVHPDHPATRVDARGPVLDATVSVGTVRLEPGHAVTATVTSADGAPVAGAWVVARPASHEPGRGTWWSADTPGEIRAGRTAADGTCTIRGLRRQKYRVAAFTSASLPSETELTPGGSEPVACALRLTDGARIRVEVVTRGAGTPVAGARLVIDRPSGGVTSWPGPPPLGFATTDAGGVAEIPGLEALPEFSVGAVPPDFASDGIHHPGPFHVGGVVKAGETLRLEMDPARTLRVRLLDAYTKQPVERATVKLVAQWDRYDRSGGSPIDLAMEWDAATQAYVTPKIRPGTWTIYAWSQGWRPGGLTNVVVPREGDVADEVIELGPATGAVSGRVVAAATGDPVEGVTVTSYEWVERLGDGHRASAASTSDGTFRLSPMLGAGFPLNVTIDAPGWCREFVQWNAEKRTDDAGTFRLTRAATIRGRMLVRDETPREAQPAANVAVELAEETRPKHSKGDGWTATTDADGRFEFTGLRPGTYILGGRRGGIAVRLGEGETLEQDIVR